jgi:predicted DNA-binding transcriptional regulator AlpA
MSLNEVAATFGVSRVALMKWVRKGLFPPPLKIGQRRRIWPRRVIEAVLAGRK